MNQRQKKKQFQKIYGKNPPEGWRVIERGNAIRKNLFIISKQNLRAFAEKIKTVFKELLEKFKRAVQAISDAWKDFQASDVQKQYKEDSTIVTTKALARQRERRKRGREWRQCWSQ